MFSQTLFLTTIILNTIIIQNCYGMESEKNKIIPFSKGIETTIPGIISKTYYDFLKRGRYIRNTYESKETFIKLIPYKKNLDNNNGDFAAELFCPIVFRESKGFIENLGRLDKIKHNEALQAICQNKALYYKKKQGALVYSLDTQPNPAICIQIKEALEHAKKQEIK